MLPVIQLPKVNTGPFMFGGNGRLSSDAPLWQPNPPAPDGTPNPQQLALDSQADELFYGGQAGGGKSDLLLGAYMMGHTHGAIFRRTYPNLKSLMRRWSEEISDKTGNFNKSEKVWSDGRRFLEFGSLQHEDSKFNWQGRAHDYYGIDEPTELTRTQYQFIIGWNRTTIPGQRCRIILAGNPPIDQDGAWVIEEWGPWLDDTHTMPQSYGDLMWYTYDEDGRIQWSREQRVGWSSRTFIPATLKDNPHLTRDGKYQARLNSMPEPLRSAFRDGDFRILSRTGNPFQVIKLEWIRAAQRRWMEMERPDESPDCVGHDVSRGGQDKTTSIGRWGEYFDILGVWPGVAITDGPTAAARVHESLDGKTPGIINVDVIGYGSSSYDSLAGMGYKTAPINVSVASTYRDKSGKLRCKDLRTELVWRMRDALDPESGVNIALPDDPDVAADLCVYTYKPLAGGVVAIKSKEEMKKEIGRSPDIGDGILLANYDNRPASMPDKQPTAASKWQGTTSAPAPKGSRWKKL